MLVSLLADEELSALDKESTNALAWTFSHYVARLFPSRKFYRQCARFAEQLPTIKRLKKSIDASEYFLARLWRAVYEHIRFGQRVEQVASAFEVKRCDISLVLSHFTDAERRKILHSRMTTTRLPEEERSNIIHAIQKHAKYLANHKLLFVAQYDRGLQMHDLATDLMEAGMYVLLRYEHFLDAKKILNYVKKSMSQKCINFQYYYAAPVRASIKGLKNNSEREFQVNKMSLEDAGVHAEVDRTRVSVPLLPCFSTLIEAVEKIPDDRVREFVSLVLDDTTYDFEHWLSRIHQKKVDDLSLAELGSFARLYLGVDCLELAHGLKDVLDEDVVRRHLSSVSL